MGHRFKTKMYSLLLVAILLITIQSQTLASFIPETTQHAILHPTINCPSQCGCSLRDLNALCSFGFSNYSISDLMPWQLTELNIHGSDKTWKSELACSSVRCVLLKNSDGLQKEHAADIFPIVFSTLTYLDISYIPIGKVTGEDFQYLTDLTVLSLPHNNISHVEHNAFKKLKKLQTLNLDGNKISVLEFGLFVTLKSLTSLQLRSNSLKMLRHKHFEGLDNLQSLNLQDNMLRQIETFVPSLTMQTLNYLDLRGNEITYIQSESVERFRTLINVDISENPLQCTCVVEELIKLYQSDSSLFNGNVFCNGPAELAGKKFEELNPATLPCHGANVTSITSDMAMIYQDNVVLDCSAEGELPLAVYWITPWGDNFTLTSSRQRFPKILSEVESEKSYYDVNLFITTKVHVLQNGSLLIELYRGHFSGDYYCIAENLIGTSNRSVTVGIRTNFGTHYLTSFFIGGCASAAMLFFAIFMGLLRLFVNKCIHSDRCNCCCCQCEDIKIIDVRKMDNGQIEVTYTIPDDHDTIEYMDGESVRSPPDPPVNSPMMRMSPDKCPTPDDDENDEPEKESHQHIWEQLDEVRSRLKVGAGRKIRKVQSHVRSITDTGSLKMRNLKDASTMKLQSIKESGSAAASIVKKNVASGMVQVKYSVKSIKEFCGTGDMGPGTVSMVSMSTDVDTKETVKIVRSHTFV